MKTKKQISKLTVIIKRGTRTNFGKYQVTIDDVLYNNYLSSHTSPVVVSIPENDFDTPFTEYSYYSDASYHPGFMNTAETKEQFIDCVFSILKHKK